MTRIQKLKRDARKMVGSLIRAEVAVISTIQGADLFGERGWHGFLMSQIIAVIPPLGVGLTAIATDIEED